MRPSEVAEAKKQAIPDFVFDIVNEFIAKEWNGSRAVVIQQDIVDEIERRVQKRWKETGQSVTRKEIFDRRWLDFEEAYRAEGWRVEYDKPAYDETETHATFTFTKKRKR